MKPIESITCPSCNVEFRREDVPPSHLCPVCGAHLLGSRAAGADPAGTAAAADPSAPQPAAKPPLTLKDWELIAKTLVGLVAAVLIAVSLFSHSAEDEARQKRQAAANAEQQALASKRAAKTAHLEPGQCITEGDSYAAVTEETLDRVTIFRQQGDFEAISKLMSLKMVFRLGHNKTVYGEYTARKARIRFPGEVNELWTYHSAVTCK